MIARTNGIPGAPNNPWLMYPNRWLRRLSLPAGWGDHPGPSRAKALGRRGLRRRARPPRPARTPGVNHHFGYMSPIRIFELKSFTQRYAEERGATQRKAR